MSITKNVCGVDRAVRIVFGTVLFAMGISLLFEKSFAGYIVIAFGIILFATGTAGRCGLYTLFGIDTCKGRRASRTD